MKLSKKLLVVCLFSVATGSAANAAQLSGVEANTTLSSVSAVQQQLAQVAQAV